VAAEQGDTFLHGEAGNISALENREISQDVCVLKGKYKEVYILLLMNSKYALS
jgi:hypothetical protein